MEQRGRGRVGPRMTDLRQVQIERDALIIAGSQAMLGVLPMKSWAEEGLGDDEGRRMESMWSNIAGLRNLTMGTVGLRLGCVHAFNESAWLGQHGILAKYRASEWRGHRCGVEDIEALVWGCAGRTSCTLYRGDSAVALLGVDADGKPIGIGDSRLDPVETAEIIWRAADLGAQLSASMIRDSDVTHPALAVSRALAALAAAAQ